MEGTEAALTLVPTKLTRPSIPSSLVDRPRLREQLDSFVTDPNGRVALVSAPAGSGKSALVSSWAADRPGPVGWLQSDEADRDPVRFWSYLVASLSTVAPALGEVPDPVVMSAAFDPEPLLALIAAELLALDAPVVTVIDDYHLVADPTIDVIVERFIDLAPTNLRLVLITRLDPALRLSRLRVRGQLAEIRAADLRFTTDEAAGLLGSGVGGGSITADHVDALCDRTEGWAAGLVLAGLSLSSTNDVDDFVTAFQGDDRLVVDYLTDEFLSTASPDDRHRLLQASVLEEMTGPLLDAVTGSDDGAAWLRSTAEVNQLMIGLDRTGTWFRYHHLLRDTLRLEADADPELDVVDLHRRAGRWHEEHGDLHRAVRHLLAADENDAAADLIAAKATHLLNGGHLHTVLRYLDDIGPTIESHASCCIVRGWTTFVSGRFTEAAEWLAKADRLDVDGIDIGLRTGLGAMIHLAQGDVASAVAKVEAGPEPAESDHARVAGAVRVWSGDMARARPLLDRALEIALVGPDDFGVCATHVFMAVLELEDDQPEAALRLADEALRAAEERGIDGAAQMSLAHSVIGRCRDDIDQARLGVETARRSPENIMLGYALASAGDVLSAAGEPDGQTFLREARSIVDRCVDPGVLGRYLARAESRHGQAAPTAQPGLIEELTDRELAVLRYLPSQLSQRDIANELYVSLNTVKTHCKAIYRKLGAGDRKAAVQAARDNGLL